MVSFLCSMLEAVILSVTPSYLASLKSKNPGLYKRVEHLKSDIEKSLASILTFNTVAHTIGAAGAGAQAQKLFGSDVLAVFSALLTFAILFFSEIIPKSIGAGSWKTLLPVSARILGPMIFVSYPVVWLSERVSSLFKNEQTGISRDEIAAMADIGLSDGALKKSEHRALKGLIKFEKVKPDDILIASENVETLSESMTVNEAYDRIQTHPFSRIIVTGSSHDEIAGYVLRTKLLKAYIEKSEQTVGDVTLPLLSLPDNSLLPSIFQKLLTRREHICAIKDRDGKFTGIITLEDLIEHMLDLEIYDEQDHLIPYDA